ncbi:MULTISPECIES: transporter [Pseudomonas]|uniref:Transporter n=1 Tax=Pseudomonas sp. Hg7Tf TaxID=3236988 RepID=A0AB39IA20_9PSED|nr:MULTISPECIES: transporter [Pseudomonas]KJK05755.1 protein involved in meta-pathway of phenol degradation [Pseudomonas sp. 5]MDD1979655.1 transporter [Pseudomonas putida]MDH2558808.1 transporter [Pseudomonas sp. Hg5Tf]QYX49402.1 transporter [Pseudomonas sp. S11A 273]
MKPRALPVVLFSTLTTLANTEAQADAVSLPPLPLGNTSFMDGVVGPGVLFELPIQHYRSSDATDPRGNAVPGRQKVQSTTVLPHLAYISQHKILGAYYGAEVLLPIVNLDLDIDGGPDGSRTRQGDLIFSPMLLQWAPVSLFGRPYWQRLNLVITAPTGDYDSDASINVGSNVWVVSPHYAFTWELTDRLEVSGRLHYAWSSRNDDPGAHLQANSIQPGEAFHSNFAVSYAVSEAWRVGLAGYQLQQVSADRIDGTRQSDSKERVLGFGPGVMYRHGSQSFFANYYVEQGARNRSEGNQLTLRYLLPF